MNYFKPKEFECPCCGASAIIVVPYVRNACNQIREHVKKPLVISSGYRCIRRNNEVGGSKQSPHLVGEAVDISTANLNGADRYKVLQKAMELNLRIGIYEKHIHIDWAINKIKLMWYGKYTK